MNSRRGLFALNAIVVAVLACTLGQAPGTQPATGDPDLPGTITAQALTLIGTDGNTRAAHGNADALVHEHADGAPGQRKLRLPTAAPGRAWPTTGCGL